MATDSFLLPIEFELAATFLMAMTQSRRLPQRSVLPHQRGDMSRKAKTCARGVVTIQRSRFTASWHAIDWNEQDVSVALRTTVDCLPRGRGGTIGGLCIYRPVTSRHDMTS